MKTLLYTTVIAGTLWSCGSTLKADDYDLTIAPGTTVNWEDASWSGGSGDYPGAGDTVDITRGDGNISYLRLPEGVTLIKALSYTGGTNHLRINNHDTGIASTLNITSGLTVEAGLLLITKLGSGHQLSVNTASTSVKSGATLRLGFSSAAISYISQTTHIAQGGNLEMGWLPSGDGIHLGDVTNNGILSLSGGTSVITDSYQIGVASLTGGALSKVTTNTTGSNANPKPTLKITGGNAAAATYQGIISDGVGKVAVSREGGGIQIFSNANTYTGGTTIIGGVLAVTNTSGSGLGSGFVEVRDQGVLSGDGIIALTDETIHVGAGGVIAPGAFGESGFSTLRLSGAATSKPILTMDKDASFTFRLGSGDQSDQIQFLDFNTHDWIINSPEGIVINATGAEIGGVYTLFTFHDGNGSAIASGLSDGLLAGVGLEGYTVLFHYGNNIGEAGYGTITMEVIPEPGIFALGAFGAALLLGHSLSRRRVSKL